MKTRKVWEILNRFKRSCTARGWKTSESEDWVRAGDEYDNFLWTRTVSLPSFKAIVSSRKCVIQEGLSYNVVEPAHTAWLFSETPSDNLVRTISDDAEFSKRVAIFDMSPLSTGKDFCVKLNNTRCPVLREFENFLQSEMKVSVKSFQQFDVVATKTDKQAMAKYA
jgi:hypothetical protein